MDALIKAYTECDEWQDAVVKYIDENENMVRGFLSEHFPDWTVMPREGTYLLWIDYRKSGWTEKELEEWFLKKAKVGVYMGGHFGPEGEGFIRVCLGTSRQTLKKALERMKAAASFRGQQQ